MSEATKTPYLCGFLNVLKPPGMSSAHVVGVIRRLLCGIKVGHGGTLDPEAAGVLPLMIGKATRLFDYIQDKKKSYVAEIAFGCSTDTQDAQGRPEKWGNCFPSRKDVEKALGEFLGEIWQQPPIYSAIKQNGQRLYHLARTGQEVDIPGRKVSVHSLTLLDMTEPYGALVSLECSKGFYVRALCHDVGQTLGCPAHMRFLLRTQTGSFTLETAHTLEEIQEAARQGTLEELLLPPETVLEHLPVALVPEQYKNALIHGCKLEWKIFPHLMNTAAAQGSPICFTLDGKLAAIGFREEEYIKMKTWLLN